MIACSILANLTTSFY